MSVWEEDPTTFSGLKCNFHPHCPWCKLPMELFDIKLLHFSINDGTPDRNSNAIDVNLYCPECGYLDVFGVAISAGHGKEMKDTLLRGIENKEFNHVVHEEKATN